MINRQSQKRGVSVLSIHQRLHDGKLKQLANKTQLPYYRWSELSLLRLIKCSTCKTSLLTLETMFGKLLRTVASLHAQAFRSSDVRRWSKNSSLDKAWDSRTEMIASLIPARSTVLEFGAGQQVLRQMLSADCEYIPSDLVERTPGTLICDLNSAKLPTIPRHDVAVFSGVLEYVHDVARAIDFAGHGAKVIVASYVSADAVPSRFDRLANGWVNALREDEFTQLFESRGWRIDERRCWGNQCVYRFAIK
jgi:hypothetical protein